MTPEEYEFEPTALPPWDHQRRCLLEYADRRYFYLSFEQRCGKSRSALDHAAYQYENGLVDAILIIAWPSGIHYNWCINEIPTFFPKRIPHRALCWFSGRDGNKTWNREFDELLRSHGVVIFAVNSEAISRKTAAVKRYIHRFIEARRVFLIADECDSFQSPNSQRTKTMTLIANRPNIISKRLLSGTPTTDSPFELYSQYNMLSPSILECPDILTFRHRYAEYEMEPAWIREPMRDSRGHVVYNPRTKRPRIVDTARPLLDRVTGRQQTRVKKSINHTTDIEFELPLRDEEGRIKYRNLDDLQRRIAPHTMRVLRSEVSDAPPKIYQKIYYEPSPEQMRVYEALRDEFETEIGGTFIQVKHVLTRLMRLQQILGNFVPARDEGVECPECDGEGCETCDNLGIVEARVPQQIVDASRDPRLEATMLYIGQNLVPTIIWARFVSEVDVLVAACESLGRSVIRYDGTVNRRDKEVGLAAFQGGEVDMLIGTQNSGGRGRNMSKADLVIFHSNDFSLATRQQAEDRAEGVMKKTSTGVVDVVARGTVDEKIIGALLAKYEISGLINGDTWREWI